MFGIQTLKKHLGNFLTEQAENAFASEKDSILLLRREGNDRVFKGAQLRLQGKVWGIFPLFKIEETGWQSLSLARDLIRPVEEIVRSVRNLKTVIARDNVQTLWHSVVAHLANLLRQHIRDLHVQRIKELDVRYSQLHKKFVGDIFAKHITGVRQNVITVVKTTAGDVLTASIQKHLAMLVMKLREEEQRRSHQNYVSSGAHALPASCKFVFRNGKASVFVLEQVPQIRNINYLDQRFQLALPYVVFAVTLRESNFYCLQMFFRNAPLQTEADELLCPALPNIDAKFVVCFPHPRDSNATPARKVEEAIQNFWGSTFNNDYSGFFIAAASQFSKLKSFDEWQRQSSLDPQFVIRLPWQSSRLTVGGLAEGSLTDAVYGESGGRPPESTTDILQEYARTLGERFSREIAEKIHFMVEHAPIDPKTMHPGKQELLTLLEETTSDLKVAIKEVLERPLEDKDLTTICKDAVKRLEAIIDGEMQDACDLPIDGIIRKVNNLF